MLDGMVADKTALVPNESSIEIEYKGENIIAYDWGDEMSVSLDGERLEPRFDQVNVANSEGRWRLVIHEHPAGHSNSRFGSEIAKWGKKLEGTLERLKSPVTADDIARAKKAGYTKEHFSVWISRYEEVAAATIGKATKTPQYRAELMQRFLDAWE